MIVDPAHVWPIAHGHALRLVGWIVSGLVAIIVAATLLGKYLEWRDKNHYFDGE